MKTCAAIIKPTLNQLKRQTDLTTGIFQTCYFDISNQNDFTVALDSSTASHKALTLKTTI